MTKVDYAELKNSGFMKQVQKDHFVLRIKVVGGQFLSEHLKKVYEIAEKYGQGYVHMTSRQSLEIPYIKLEDIEDVKLELATAGLKPGACGARVRTITACQGCAICPSGLIDTTELAREFDQRYFARALPHKFKLGITGCRNNCLKAEENDLGVKGGIQTKWVQDKCTFCGLCQVACPSKAIKVERAEKQLYFDEQSCNYCGRCMKSCPVHAWEGRNGFSLYFGGLYGNRIAVGKQLLPIIFDKETVHKVVEITLDFFQKHGKSSERFRNTLDRVGWHLLEADLQEGLK